MTLLSVNVNKLATLRNARGKNNPDVTALSHKLLGWGAHGITVHPRPDGRHVRHSDVLSLSELVKRWNQSEKRQVEFNIEGFPSDDFIAMICKVRPHQCTLVPDPPEALTSDAGWDLEREKTTLQRVLKQLREAGVRNSVFVDPAKLTPAQAGALKDLKPDRIELYTESYALAFSRTDRESVTAIYRQAAEVARKLGVGLNAGHDLDQVNLGFLIAAIPWIEEVSIGHALICEALEQGLEQTTKAYLKILGAK